MRGNAYNYGIKNVKKGKKDPDAVKMGVPGDQVSHATCYDNAVYILCNLLTN